MCSRQERIQKDIDVVIQKSRAEKDCLFAGEFSPFQSFGPGATFSVRPPFPFPILGPRRLWLVVGLGCTSPIRGSSGNSCCSESESQKGEGAPASPLPPGLGQSPALGAKAGGPSRDLGRGAVRGIFVPRGCPERPSLPPGFQRQRPSGVGRTRRVCAMG